MRVEHHNLLNFLLCLIKAYGGDHQFLRDYAIMWLDFYSNKKYLKNNIDVRLVYPIR